VRASIARKLSFPRQKKAMPFQYPLLKKEALVVPLLSFLVLHLHAHDAVAMTVFHARAGDGAGEGKD
jgi:hypothetical protein